jgi:predicted O-methyltransferase YrrM
MTNPTEAFIGELFASEDVHLRRIREAMAERGLPAIQLPRITARTIQILLRAIGARRVLEIGTLAGYSALWVARALPEDGRIVTVEKDPERMRLALELLRASGVAGRVEGRVGEAAEVLAAMEDAVWDAVFLDADKEGLPGYVTEARRLLRPGGLLLVDNALWKGRVVDPAVDDEATGAIRRALREVADDPAFDATLLPVGDGLLVALRQPDPQ